MLLSTKISIFSGFCYIFPIPIFTQKEIQELKNVYPETRSQQNQRKMFEKKEDVVYNSAVSLQSFFFFFKYII